MRIMEMSYGEPNCRVALIFWLNLHEKKLRDILVRGAQFNEIKVPSQDLVRILNLGISLAPTRLPVASYKSVRIYWDNSRYVLSFEGPPSEIREAIVKVIEAFEENAYRMENLCSLYEIIMSEDIVNVDMFVEKLRKKINIEFSYQGETFKPFSISLSNFDAPTPDQKFYNWFLITINPEPLSPQNRITISISKRGTKIDDLLDFLGNLDELVRKIIEFFVEE